MERCLLCLALVLAAAVPVVGLVDRGALYPGKTIRRADGICITVLRPDPSANGYWWIHLHNPQLGPIELSEHATDLLATERGELPPFHRQPPCHPPAPPDARR
jgi:hypothetical protein